MKYIYLTESGTADNAALPAVNNEAVEQVAFLDVKTFKKLRKKIKAIYGKQTEPKEADQKIVIIYNTPVAIIASGLRSQIEPAQLVAQWCQQAEALVELFKQYQSNCILANINALKTDMTDLVKLVRMSKKERAIFSAFSQNAPEADIYTLSAYYLIENNDTLKRQQSILDACTVFNDYQETPCDIQLVITQQRLKEKQSQQQLEKASTLEEKLIEKQAEITLCTQQIESLTQQNILEKQNLIQCESNQEIVNEKFKTTIKELSQDKESTHKQLTALQDILEDQTKKIQAINAEKNNLNEAFKSSQIEVGKQIDENVQIIEQLHFVQEAFEESILNLNTLKSEMLTVENVKVKLNEEFNNAQAELKKQINEKAMFTEQLYIVQEALDESILDSNKLKTKAFNLQKQIDRSESHQTWLVKELLESHKKLNAKSWSYRGLLKKQVAIIKASGLFDEAWYVETYPEIAESKMPPILHYLLYGVIEARNPSAEFNTKNYLSIYVDVANQGMNPLIHYINFGKAEGRKADPLQKRLPSPKAQ